MSGFKRLIHEIHRRSLWQVLLIYVGASWVVLEAADVMVSRLALPEWVYGAAIVLLLVGLPIVLGTAFVQEGLSAAPRHDPTLLPGAEVESEARPREVAGARRLFTWRNAISGGVLAFGLWGVVATGWLLLGREGGGERDSMALPVEDTRVAVFPFSFRGSDELSYLGEGMADLLATALDGAGKLRAVDNRAILAATTQAGAPDADHAREIARRLGAGSFVLGDAVEVGGRLQVSAVFYSPASGLKGRRASVEGVADDELFEIVNDLAVGLLVGESGHPGERLTQVAAVTTDSLRALKAYLEGEADFRVGRFFEAKDAFQRAAAVDSTFALAWYRLSVAAGWTSGTIRLRQDAAEKAVRYASRLSARERRLLEAFLAWERGGLDAERLYRAIVGEYPSDVEAREQLGEVLFHYGPQRGRSLVDSRGTWQRLLFLEPANVSAYYHLARIAALEGRHAELDSLVSRVVELTPESTRNVELRALRAFAVGDSIAQEEIKAQLADNWNTNALRSVARYTTDLAGAMSLARMELKLAPSPEIRAESHRTLAALELARGRWRAALEELTVAESLDAALGLEYRILFSLSPILERSRTELEELYAQLAAWDAADVPLNTDLISHNRIHPQLKDYLAGVLSVRLGETSRAEEYATTLERMPGPAATGSLHADLARSVRAQAAWSGGRLQEALSLLEQMQRVWNESLFRRSPFFSQALERYLQAELLQELGRDEEALALYNSASQPGLHDLVYRAPSHLRSAEIYERLGDHEKAVYHYGRFIHLWKDADPELQPRVEAARRAISALSTDR